MFLKNGKFFQTNLERNAPLTARRVTSYILFLHISTQLYECNNTLIFPFASFLSGLRILFAKIYTFTD